MRKTKLFIVGTCHNLQCGTSLYSEDKLADFRAYVMSLCEIHRIKHIAEEMNKDCLILFDVKYTVASKIAKSMKLSHSYVEMSNKVRSTLSIARWQLNSIAQNISLANHDYIFSVFEQNLCDPIRERYWLTQILIKNVWPTLLICGSNHVINIELLASGIKIQPMILCNDYSPSK